VAADKEFASVGVNGLHYYSCGGKRCGGMVMTMILARMDHDWWRTCLSACGSVRSWGSCCASRAECPTWCAVICMKC